jgi:TolB-like protein
VGCDGMCKAEQMAGSGNRTLGFEADSSAFSLTIKVITMAIALFRLVLLIPMVLMAAATHQKLTFAVLNIKGGSEISTGEAEIISDRLRIEIFKTGLVDMMEREQMQSILKEQGFQASGACTDEGCMVQMGQMLGVQFLIAGSIGKLGTLFLVNARSVNVATGKIEKVVSVDIKGNIEDVVDELPRIARQLTSSDVAEPIVVYNATKPPAPSSPPPSSESGSSSIPSDSLDDKITTPDQVDCKTDVVLEAVDFSGAINFRLNGYYTKDIHEDLCDAINEFFDREIRVIPAARLKELSADCNAPLVRVHLVSYSTSPSSRGQVVGTAEVSFLFYDSPDASQPGCSITIKEEGNRHWGDQQPFVNAFEAIAERLQEELSDSNYLKKLKRTLDR